MAGAGTALVALATASTAAAQAIPSPVAPGRIEQQFEPAPTPKALPPAPLPAPAPAPARPASGLHFVLKDIVVEGATVYTPAQLREAYAKYLGQTIAIEQLPEIEEAITLKYRRDGYILARAIIPDNQAIEPSAGVIHVRVYEGYIDKVRLDPLDYEVGERGGLLKRILKKIEHACRSGDEPAGGHPCPLHRDVLERYLLLANDLPGVKVSAVIQPSVDKSGAADLFVTVSEKPLDVTAKLDNRGSAYIGPLQAEFAGSLNNLMGLYDRTAVRVIGSIPFNELYVINAVEEIPLTAEGLRLAVGGTHARAKPGDLLRSQNLVTNSNSLGVSLSYPFLRTRSENLLLHGGFTFRNSRTAVPAQRVFDDRTRVLNAGATYDLADRWLGVNLVDVGVSQGLDAFNATPNGSTLSSHAGAGGRFTKFDAELSRLQRIFPEWNVLAAVTGQYALDKLLVSEQFGFGGERFGRGYDPSEILGDSGIAGKVELQYTPSWGPGLLGTGDWVNGLQFYAFYDIGRVWNLGAGEPDLSAASAGAGVRFTIADHLSGYLEVARPLTRPVQAEVANGRSGKAPRFFFSIATRF